MSFSKIAITDDKEFGLFSFKYIYDFLQVRKEFDRAIFYLHSLTKNQYDQIISKEDFNFSFKHTDFTNDTIEDYDKSFIERKYNLESEKPTLLSRIFYNKIQTIFFKDPIELRVYRLCFTEDRVLYNLEFTMYSRNDVIPTNHLWPLALARSGSRSNLLEILPKEIYEEHILSDVWYIKTRHLITKKTQEIANFLHLLGNRETAIIERAFETCLSRKNSRHRHTLKFNFEDDVRLIDSFDVLCSKGFIKRGQFARVRPIDMPILQQQLDIQLQHDIDEIPINNTYVFQYVLDIPNTRRTRTFQVIIIKLTSDILLQPQNPYIIATMLAPIISFPLVMKHQSNFLFFIQKLAQFRDLAIERPLELAM